MSVIKPLTYDEVKKANIEHRKNNIPDFVIEAINSLLIINCNTSKTISISQNVILDKIIEFDKNKTCSRNEIIDNGYLDFEELYTDYGWEVKYYKPAYNEVGDGSFSFRSLT